MLQSYIALFDSGVGGLTVLSALRRAYPQHNFIYLGDTARVPYGTKSEAIVTRYALELTAFLNRYPLTALIVACNTASAVAIPALRVTYPKLPVLGVVEPGAQAALRATQSKRIVVLGTEATIASGAYREAVHKLDAAVEVIGIACPLFVPLAEEGLLEGELPQLAARHYLKDMDRWNVDTVLLGCTHYPLLRKTIEKAVGPEICVVDSAIPLVEELEKYLPPESGKSLRVFTTDSPQRFMRIGEKFLGAPVIEPTRISIEDMVYQTK